MAESTCSSNSKVTTVRDAPQGKLQGRRSQGVANTGPPHEQDPTLSSLPGQTTEVKLAKPPLRQEVSTGYHGLHSRAGRPCKLQCCFGVLQGEPVGDH